MSTVDYSIFILNYNIKMWTWPEQTLAFAIISHLPGISNQSKRKPTHKEIWLVYLAKPANQVHTVQSDSHSLCWAHTVFRWTLSLPYQCIDTGIVPWVNGPQGAAVNMKKTTRTSGTLVMSTHWFMVKIRNNWIKYYSVSYVKSMKNSTMCA